MTSSQVPEVAAFVIYQYIGVVGLLGLVGVIALINTLASSDPKRSRDTALSLAILDIVIWAAVFASFIFYVNPRLG